MKTTMFVLLSVLVVFALANPLPAKPSRTVETTIDLDYNYDYDYDRKSNYKYERRPEYIEYVLKPNVKPKYEIVRETDMTIEYDSDAAYDGKKSVKKSVRSKRTVCKDC